MSREVFGQAQGLRPRGALAAAHGARAVEAALLREVKQLCADVQRDPKLLARPVRIIVASNRLRENLCAKLAQDLGLSIAGLTVQTLYYVAKEALERSGESSTSTDALFSALVREAAKTERDLFRDLQRIPSASDAKDGFESLAATVHDLIDAGFTAEAEEFLCERLAAAPVPQRSVARAQAIVRIAAKVLCDFDHLHLSHRATLLQRAKGCIVRDSARALPSRAILVHGFADATGVATDLLETLVQHCGAKVFFDFPLDPAQLAAEAQVEASATESAQSSDPARGLDCAWSEPLRTRLSGIAGRVSFEADAPNLQATQIRVIKACGALEEVREVVRRIRQALDKGAVPEKMAIVARDFEAYATLLRSELTAAGIPFSGNDARGPRSRDGNYLLRLVQLLREQGDARIELWVSLCAQIASQASDMSVGALNHQADLQMRMTQFGVIRVKDLQPLGELRDALFAQRKRAAAPEDDVGGTEVASDSDESVSESSQLEAVNSQKRRFVLSKEFSQIQKKYIALEKLWKGWPARAPLVVHQKCFEEFVKQWHVEATAETEECAQRILDVMHEDWPSSCEVDRTTFLKILDEKAAKFGYLDFGGQGAGVQVLSVMDARACTFESVFTLGLQRGSFPRLITEDALLSDSLRDLLRDMLPDLPAKRRGFDEERFLFAQLCQSAPQVTLSFHTVGFDGKPKNPSPFIERLRLAKVACSDERAAPLYPKPQSGAPQLASAFDLAIQMGLAQQRNAFARALFFALREAEDDLQTDGDEGSLTAEEIDFEKVTAARVRIVHEFDRGRHDQHYFAFSPYSGFVQDSDPATLRPGDFYVTSLEKLAACPWQFFINHVLKVSPTVDLRSSLFERDALFGGTFVHRVLAKIAQYGEPAEGGAHRAAWPTESKLQELWGHALEESLAKVDSVFSSALRVQSKNWWKYLEVAKEDWLASMPQDQATQDSFEIIGVEQEDSVRVEDRLGRMRELHFRADRIDRCWQEDEMRLRFTDYKTGKLSEKKDFEEGLLRGTHLQVMAYVHSELARSHLLSRADSTSGDAQAIARATGRYLYLKPSDPGERHVDSQEAAREKQFREIVAVLFLLRDRSVFFPRIFKDAESKSFSDACKYCAFAVACHRSDIAFQARFESWLAAAQKTRQAANPPTASEYTLENVFEEGWKR